MPRGQSHKTESPSTMQGTNIFSTISYQGALHKCKVVQQARHALDQTCHFSTSSFIGANHAHRQTKVPRKDLKTLTTGLQQCVFSPCTRFSGSCHPTKPQIPLEILEITCKEDFRFLFLDVLSLSYSRKQMEWTYTSDTIRRGLRGKFEFHCFHGVSRSCL